MKALVFRGIGLAVLPFFLGCAKDHGVPAATLDYLELKREEGVDLYKVTFSSSIDFFYIFEPGKRPISSTLRCAPGLDEVSKDHGADPYTAVGLVSVAQPQCDGKTFIYSATLLFDENLNEGRSRRMLNTEELQSILQGKQSMPCVYTATGFGFKAYRSAIM